MYVIILVHKAMKMLCYYQYNDFHLRWSEYFYTLIILSFDNSISI